MNQTTFLYISVGGTVQLVFQSALECGRRASQR